MQKIISGRHMNIMNYQVALALLALTLSTTAHSLEPMSATQLSRTCEKTLKDDTNMENSACTGFIRGYIEANAKIRITENGDLSFTQRALLSRAPSGSTSIATLKNAQYCLSGSTSISELAALIVDTSTPSYTGTAASLIDQIVKTHYLC